MHVCHMLHALNAVSLHYSKTLMFYLTVTIHLTLPPSGTDVNRRPPVVRSLVCLWLCFAAKLRPGGEGDLCFLHQDCLSPGAAGGQPAGVPQHLLPLHSL